MEDTRRFIIFAEYIERNFPVARYHDIADIAGGAGHLQVALRQRNYDVVTYDPVLSSRVVNGNRQVVSKTTNVERFDLLVGLHPDQATDVIIYLAWLYEIPFAIVPCCVMPTITTYKGDTDGWIHHLINFARSKGISVEVDLLEMNGMNQVLIGKMRD